MHAYQYMVKYLGPKKGRRIYLGSFLVLRVAKQKIRSAAKGKNKGKMNKKNLYQVRTKYYYLLSIYGTTSRKKKKMGR